MLIVYPELIPTPKLVKSPGLPAIVSLTVKDNGFEILDFPCNQFANQAPGTDDEIHTFCTGRFGITFPQFGKIDVNGKNEDPLYTYLKKQKGGFCTSKIKWNFTKFLIGKDGTVLKRFGPTVTPEKIDAFVASALK